MKKFLLIFSVVCVLATSLVAYSAYKILLVPNVHTQDKEEYFLKIPSESTFEDVVNLLTVNDIIQNKKYFELAAQILKYDDAVLAGRYRVRDAMSNQELILLLRSGRQSTVKLILRPTRSLAQIASKAAATLEADSASIINMMQDTAFLNSSGFNSNSVFSMFIPNTYEFYWNTSAEGFLKKMKREYEVFWNDERLQLAKNLQLSPMQVSTIASIVEQETNKNDEKNRIAGVYLNRLRKNWKLDADPTLVFALNDFTIRRVLNIHKKIDSPYNTYVYGGLPPGPICNPSIASLDAVLNYEKHDYMFFCAKDDFSGYHNFARNYTEHLFNARRFQREMNKRKIKK